MPEDYTKNFSGVMQPLQMGVSIGAVKGYSF